jgi:hypothetical protein
LRVKNIVYLHAVIGQLAGLEGWLASEVWCSTWGTRKGSFLNQTSLSNRLKIWCICWMLPPFSYVLFGGACGWSCFSPVDARLDVGLKKFKTM